LLYTAHANAGIHEVGVFKEHRGKGIAKALVYHALRQAISDGAAISTLQASPAGKPLYASMGYTEVSTIQNWICPRKLAK
ncbi:MAG: GNAT family N-acetyltransferase, partial [Eubacterium sp.]|nr:GNAT family N-acetyltransferase [Eubacterium sp.]